MRCLAVNWPSLFAEKVVCNACQAVAPFRKPRRVSVFTYSVRKYLCCGSHGHLRRQTADWPHEFGRCFGEGYWGRRNICSLKSFATQKAAAKPEKLPLVADTGPVSVIYEDDFILVIDKPAGLKHEPLHRFVGGSLVNLIYGYLGKEPYTIHRLDMYTSGVVCFAKERTVAKSLSEQFLSGRVSKVYATLVAGVPAGDFCVSAPIARDPGHKFARTVSPSGGKSASTEFRVVDSCRASGVSLLEATLRTGRTHQIRVHLRYAGHPIVGDEIYGCSPLLWDGVYGPALSTTKKSSSMDVGKGKALVCTTKSSSTDVGEGKALTGIAIQRQALHAASFAFEHPITGERLACRANLPPDMREAVRAFSLNAEAFVL